MEFLAATGNTSYPKLRTHLRWVGGDFDTRRSDMQSVNQLLRAEHRRWISGQRESGLVGVRLPGCAGGHGTGGGDRSGLAVGPP